MNVMKSLESCCLHPRRQILQLKQQSWDDTTPSPDQYLCVARYIM